MTVASRRIPSCEGDECCYRKFAVVYRTKRSQVEVATCPTFVRARRAICQSFMSVTLGSCARKHWKSRAIQLSDDLRNIDFMFRGHIRAPLTKRKSMHAKG